MSLFGGSGGNGNNNNNNNQNQKCRSPNKRMIQHIINKEANKKIAQTKKKDKKAKIELKKKFKRQLQKER